ncbi:ribbon-helix-helix domain-containing protein [Corynebacterium sp. p3-SID1194]|uniref:ribbon-helix-helix domain-containing protein n=1 Tax=Corynebacterium sp. p3-SID1194 TaxID=2916105 RepID=UPI0021A74B5E|nr:ribbon-helix-helix domain-containing protein [Corynebacterium sp. p3-SID1194]MCT1450880.1 ribbon-helix-helix domain-containing protein [Corynebacterium sp. p3-SID1194]
MTKRTIKGKEITDAQIQAWADEAEVGYDPATLPPARPGRPSIGDGPGSVVPVRLDAATIAAVMEKAKAEGFATRSDAIREAIRKWISAA